MSWGRTGSRQEEEKKRVVRDENKVILCLGLLLVFRLLPLPGWHNPAAAQCPLSWVLPPNRGSGWHTAALALLTVLDLACHSGLMTFYRIVVVLFARPGHTADAANQVIIGLALFLLFRHVARLRN